MGLFHSTLDLGFFPLPTPTSYPPLPLPLSHRYPYLLPSPTSSYQPTPTYHLPLQPTYLPHLPSYPSIPLPPTYPYLPTPTYPSTHTSYLPTYPFLLPTPTLLTNFLLFCLIPLTTSTFHCLNLLWPFVFQLSAHVPLTTEALFWSHDLSSSSSSPFLTFSINLVISLHCIFSTTTFMIYSPIFIISPLCFGMGNSKGDGKPLNPPRPCVDFKHKSCLVHSPGLLIHW